MLYAKILIIDSNGECSLSAVKVLMPLGFSVFAANSRENALQMMGANSPDLILADSSVTPEPMVLLEDINRLNLPAQIIAVTDKPDFNQAMDWVAGGIFNVLTKPLDENRLHQMVIRALEHRALFQSVAAISEQGSMTSQTAESELCRSLKSFYQGLAGRLELTDLIDYATTSVKKLTGASHVEIFLTSDETNPAADDKTEQARPANLTLKANQGLLTFDLAVKKCHLGQLGLFFKDKNFKNSSSNNALNSNRFRQIAEPWPDSPGQMAEIIAALSAAFDSVFRYQKAVNLAARDGLTGLYNHRTFSDTLKREFAQAKRHNLHLSLLSLDLDHFKSVNDNFGHQTGDMVLKSVAQVIAKVARNTDLAARVGGEEFAIILPHTSQEQAYVVAERLKIILAESAFNLGGTVFRQTISQGLVGLEHFMIKSPEDMVYWADQALYLAKREGRDTIRTASDLPMTPVIKDGRPYAFQ